MKKVTIIGGGLSSLSASCYLAKNNFDVTIVEKNNSLGGRLSKFSENGFTFDMGPSWYWMPDVFDSFFKDFEKQSSDYFDLVRLDPSYRFFVEDKTYDVPANLASFYDMCESIEQGSSSNLKKFLDDAKLKYDISFKSFINLPNLSAFEYFSPSVLRYILSLDLLSNLRDYISKFFKSKQMRLLLEFPSMFLGGSPLNTPALYSLMNYADIVGGTWYPMGGMYRISESFEKLSLELGVKHVVNEEVSGFNINNKSIDSIQCSHSKIYKSDVFLAGAEYPYIQLNFLDEKFRSYSDKYWRRRDVAPSALIFYVGLSKKIDGMQHHNLFFDKDFNKHLNEIFSKEIWPTDPLFYVCCPSKTDPSVIPDGDYENLFILIPIGPGSEDSDSIRSSYFNKVILRIEEKFNVSIQDSIVYKKSFCVDDFKHRYNAFKGNAYGLANTLSQTAVFKPKIRDKKINNLYYSGHFTVPGPGLPPAVISGKIAANQIIKDFK